MTNLRPPRLAFSLVQLVVPVLMRESVLGDLEEEFHERALRTSARGARRWYRRQAVGLLFARWVRPHEDSRPGGLTRQRFVSQLQSIAQDARRAARSLRRQTGFSGLVVVTLALGIGATTAVFSLSNWLLFQPIPGVTSPDRVAIVWFGQHSEHGVRVSSLSYPNHADLVPTLTALDGFAGHQVGSAAVATGETTPDYLAVGFVMANYFDVLGVPLQLGRGFTPAEDDYRVGGAFVAVISNRLWRSMLSADSTVIGKTLLVNGVRVEIVGVARRGFHGVERLDDTDIWMPGAISPVINHFPAERRTLDRVRGGYYEYVGRLAEDATFDQLRGQLDLGVARLAEAYPVENEKFTEVSARVFEGAGLPPLGRNLVVPTMRLLMGIVILVLLIACANVANLFLFRGMRRAGESAVRRALGASSWRVIRELLVESTLLSFVGAVMGLGAAVGLMQLFKGATIGGAGGSIDSLSMDWRVLGFTFLAALSSALLFGIVPAVVQTRVNLVTPLKAGARTETGRTAYVRSAFAVVQLSVSLTLLVGALLFIRTIISLTEVDLGFDPSGVVTASVSPDRLGYDEPASRAYFQELHRRIAALPGVEAVGLADVLPFTHTRSTRIYLAGTDPESHLEVLSNDVSRDFFASLTLPLLRGRTFDQGEVLTAERADSFGVVILSEALADRLFPSRDPLGQSVAFHTMAGQGKRYEVVGVVGNLQWNSFDEDQSLFVYAPLAQSYGVSGSAHLLITAPGLSAGAVIGEAERIAEQLDPALPLTRPQALTDAIADRMSQQQLFAKLLSVFAILALVLSGVGVYGLVAQGVAARTREFGIRIALGAERGSILALVLRGSLWLGLVGTAVGVVGAISLSRVVQNRLFGVTGLDPLSYVTAATILFAIVIVAGMIPARSATSVNPVNALKSD